MASFVVLSLDAAKRPRWMSSPPKMVMVRTSERPAGSWASVMCVAYASSFVHQYRQGVLRPFEFLYSPLLIPRWLQNSWAVVGQAVGGR